ncbi:MAG: hypothetical protein J6I40_04500, partial [Mailhella sp.]|nr:hypothetical protein [Mailhella sp.]
MATREEMLAEAYSRGILPQDMAQRYEEYMRRQAVEKAPGVAADKPGEMSWGEAALQGVRNIPGSA